MNSRISNYFKEENSSTSMLRTSFVAHSAKGDTGNTMTPLNSPTSSHRSNAESLPSPWIKPHFQGAEVSTHPEPSSAHLISTSKTLPDPDSTEFSPQSNHVSNIKRDSTRTSDITALPFPSTRTLPAPTGFTNYMKTMKSKSQHLGPPSLPPARQLVRKRREFLLVQALKDSILNFSKTNQALRASIADEVKKGVENTLTGIEKDPGQIVMTVGSQGKDYWSKIHQDFDGCGKWRNQPLYQIYSKKDIERILFFWAIHQGTLSYGEIACRLHLPVGALLSWILGFVNRAEDI